MTRAITTSIRLTPALRAALEKASHDLHRGKNWIIVHALEAYLEKMKYKMLEEEARRQSLLAAKEDDAEEMQFWEENSDTTGWE